MAQGQGGVMIARLRARLRRPMNLDRRLAEYDRRTAQYDKRLRRKEPRQ